MCLKEKALTCQNYLTNPNRFKFIYVHSLTHLFVSIFKTGWLYFLLFSLLILWGSCLFVWFCFCFLSWGKVFEETHTFSSYTEKGLQDRGGLRSQKNQFLLKGWGFKVWRVFLPSFRVGQFEESWDGWLAQNCCVACPEQVLNLLSQSCCEPTGGRQKTPRPFILSCLDFCLKSEGKEGQWKKVPSTLAGSRPPSVFLWYILLPTSWGKGNLPVPTLSKVWAPSTAISCQ
jgi:hypothetical protein